MELKILPILQIDAYIIQNLIQSGMRPDIFHKTIFSSRGYTTFLENILSFPESLRNIKFRGAYLNNRLVGFAEYRILNDSVFLNNIYVDKELQGKNIGKFLLETGYELADKYKKDKILLDVFDDNYAALAWYEKEGFKKISATNWYLGNQQAHVSKSFECLVENYPSAQAEQRLYYFSNLKIKTDTALYDIGRIKETFYRITSDRILEDTSILNGLYWMDPVRELIILTQKTKLSGFINICTSNRMEKIKEGRGNIK
ncbi:GNAT family N-acetyltransferase [Metabacillus idriensis]|uniref:GNAT family N-acetyltransferase n=1 Tax=Metabacillus idriensis TaxID=324768 RepID=A0A6I2MBC0_9BACI|nr:GNAT family N-acetyltransferase [Metabacillus idriensis]MCM3598329.1 GNAT family N-acetyltransferase [Metabacillus idriensis]MRX55049.1 GNAT family N-acetyltransferase [Metabacillus idriensis]OHR71603.1 hypothetical protein HMPREF3291_23940 [Bacillus sp. HMSC76G11]